MKPWALKTETRRPDDSFTIPLWAPYKPKDFYFAIIWEDETKTTVVYIVPGDYYDLTGKMFDDSIPIIQYLPSYLEEVSECEYETTKPMTEVQRDMTKLGFMNDHYFQRHIVEHGKLGIV